MRLTIQRYEEHKDSGIEWLGKIPEHWDIKRVKELATLVLGKMLDNKPAPNKFYRHYLKSKNIRWFNVDISSVDQMYFTPNEMKTYRLKADDLLLSEGGEVGKTSIWREELNECYIQNSVHKVTVFKNQHPQYHLYQSVLLGQLKYYDSIVNQVSIKHLTKEKLSRVFWLFPPLEEQKTIADYLDTKTAQIDRKIHLLTQKAQRYEELKRSLINETVTGRRIDNGQLIIDNEKSKNCQLSTVNYPLYKDSGIEWIGKIPEHWDVKRIKDISYINKKTLTEKTSKDYEFDYIDISSVTYGVRGFVSERMKFSHAPSRAKRIVKKGDTIISTVRTYLKAITSFEDEISDVIVSTGFAVISPKKVLKSKYFAYLATSNFLIDKICSLSVGVSYPATNASVIADLLCLVPPLSEQKAIADYLDTKTAQIDQIIQTINTQIEKLKELRKTLINDVV
ncbi:MAG: restriction endonuclease subunit S, partial [Microcystaceae cyanobacterium]